MSAEITITLHLNNKPFKLKIQPEAEEALRNSVKKINDHINQYKINYTGMEEADYLSMALITVLTEQASQSMTVIENEEELESLQKLNTLLS
jgi:hypothetical protein